MINIQSEQILTFAQAAASLPRRRGGRPVAVSTLYRWSTTGLRGIRLETLYIGGTRCTSQESLERFFHALTVRGQGYVGADKPVSRPQPDVMEVLEQDGWVDEEPLKTSRARSGGAS